MLPQRLPRRPFQEKPLADSVRGDGYMALKGGKLIANNVTVPLKRNGTFDA